MRPIHRVALAVIFGLAIGLFIFLPFVPESIHAPFGACSPGSCQEGVIHFTVSLSCYVAGDSPSMFLGDSYSPQMSVNGDHLFYGCHLVSAPPIA